jgi:hypothetical protein
MRYFIQVDKKGKPKLGSQVYTKPKVGNLRLAEITDYIPTTSSSGVPEIPETEEKFYILLDNRGLPISGTVTNMRPLTRFADISLVAVFAGCCSVEGHITQTLENFNSIEITTYPVGVFNYTGDYIGIADNSDEYATLWNSDAGNAAKATLYKGETDFKFKLILKDPEFTGHIKGLNFYNVSFFNAGNLTLNLDDNSVILDRGNGNLFFANNYASVVSTTNLFFEFGFYDWSVQPTFTYRNVALNNYSGGTVSVFHNGLDNVFAHDYNNIMKSMTGVLPKGIKWFFARSVYTNDFSKLNWNELSELLWLAIDNFGGGNIYITSAIAPKLYNSRKLKGLWLGEFGINNVLSGLNWINKTNLPELTTFLVTGNGGGLNTYDAAFWENFPVVTNMIRIRPNGAWVPEAVTDAIFNQLRINLDGVVPTGNKKLLRIEGTAATAASQAARDYLTAQGWTITLG